MGAEYCYHTTMGPAVKYRFIKKATPAQAKEIITLYRAQGWWDKKASAAALNRLIRGSHCFVAAERDGKIIGMGRAISDRAGDAYLQDVTVDPAERGSGAGRGIVTAIERRLKRDGISWIALIAQDNSEPFYLKLGFKTLRRARPMLAGNTYV